METNSLQNHIISAVVTFVSSFLGMFGSILIAVPADTWHSPEVLTTAFWMGLIITAIRATIRVFLKDKLINY